MISDCLTINSQGHLVISGCDTVELVREYGTPLYVMSEDKIRQVCRRYLSSFQKNYDGYGCPIYASKAFSCKEIYRIIAQEGLETEVVSGGELYTALLAGVPAEKIHFQGNNKTPDELQFAVEKNVGDIVVDNFYELELLEALGERTGKKASISFRVKPGIDAHTHEFIRTGQIDSKFGLDLQSEEALEAVKKSQSMKFVSLKGLHCHIGSQIMEKEPFVHAAQVMLDFFFRLKKELGITLEHLNLGGGFGIKYIEKDDTIPYEDYMETVSRAVHKKCAEADYPIPKIYIEPGRSIVGEAGITLYTVGAVKEIPQVRNYVSIDGGMFENPRYALYQAEYTCLLGNRANDPADYLATIAGKCCESGDLIQENTLIQKPQSGDILAVLSTGAYNYSMASNYNRNPRPACVMVSKGKSRVIIRRETYEDLVLNDL